MMAVIRPAHHKLLQTFADQRHEAQQIGGHPRRPIAFLIPRQQIAGQRQPQHDQHENQPQPEIHFARARYAPSITTCNRCSASSTTIACDMK